MRTCVILNPNAGSADEIAALEGHLRQLGAITLHHTERPGDAARFARQALKTGYERIIAAGGDGTIHQVANGLAALFERKSALHSRYSPPRLAKGGAGKSFQEQEQNSGPAFGVLPLGTGNDFARSIGMPLNDVTAAVDVLAACRTQPVDIARLDGPEPAYFLNTAGAGFTARLAENLSSTSKEWLGPLAYIFEGAKTIPQLEEHRLRLTLDSASLELAAYNIIVANGRFIGGGIPISPQARLNDGLLDAIILPALPLTDLALAVRKILAGTHDESDGIMIRQAARIIIDAEPAMPINLDGEPKGETPATLTVVPAALKVICGPA